ncbi:MAG: hypothetical protein R3F11_21825 [Verrucomicrobiales bacterium]
MKSPRCSATSAGESAVHLFSRTRRGHPEEGAERDRDEADAGFGSLDYRPILAALRDIGFTGWAEIFMHPTPRGEPILPTKEEITAAINKSRAYLADCLGKA